MDDAPVATEAARRLIGSVIEEAVSDPISVHHLRQYLVGTNDRNPAYAPDDADTTARSLTPPLFFFAAMRNIVYRSDLLADGQHQSLGVGGITGRTVEGGTEFELHRSVRVGDVIRMEKRVASIDEKTGRSGALVVLVTLSKFSNQLDELVAEMRHTIIFR